VQNHVQQGFVDVDSAVVFNESHFSKPVHEATDTRSVVPIMFASASCVIGGIMVSGSPVYQIPPSTRVFAPVVSRYVEKLINKVFLRPHSSKQNEPQKQIGEFMFLME